MFTLLENALTQEDYALSSCGCRRRSGALSNPPASERYGAYFQHFSIEGENNVQAALAACYLRGLYERESGEGTLVLTAAGDTTFGQYPEVPPDVSYEDELDRRGGDFGFPLRLCGPVFQTDDLSVLNYEGTLTTSEDQVQ